MFSLDIVRHQRPCRNSLTLRGFCHFAGTDMALGDPSIRTINSPHIKFRYKGECFWVFISTFGFKAVRFGFRHYWSPWWLPSCVTVAGRLVPSPLPAVL